MLVGVVSDTHDNLENVEKAISVLKKRKVAAVIHAGDIIAPFTLKKFADINADFYGVFGNNDGEIVLLLKIASQLGFKLNNQPLELDLGGRKLVIFHGFGGVNTTKRFVNALAREGYYDVIVFGHIHEIVVKKVGKTLVLNPGEVFGGLSGKSTLAILDTETLEVELVEF